MPGESTAARAEASAMPEDQLRSFLTEVLKKKGATVRTEVPVRRGLSHRVVDLVATSGDQIILFEVRSQPASIDAITALEAAQGTVKATMKVIVSPDWDSSAARDLAASTNVKLVKPTDLLSGAYTPL